ncbi:MAG: hypothetical protein HQ523_15610 [Lentisphaerae bacterium]|nr:hypothetical protein [Lentisphaerota bacterium]
MEEALAPAIDLLLLILTFFVKVGLLRLVLRILARHMADTALFKTMFVTALIGGTYGMLSFSLRDPLGPAALGGALVVSFLASRFLCWLTWRKAAYVALMYSALLIGVSVGTVKAADWVAPNRVTFLEAFSKAKAGLSSMRVAEGKAIDWQWIFGRAFEAVAHLTEKGERDRLSADISKGMEVYQERKKAMQSLVALKPAEGQPTALEALSTLATGEVSDAMFDNVMLSDLAGGGATSAPLPLADSLAQISSNLTAEGGLAGLASLMATGTLGMAELITDAVEFQSSNTNGAANADMVLDAAANVMSHMGGLPSLPPGGAESPIVVASDHLMPEGKVAVAPGTRLIPEGQVTLASGESADPSYELLNVAGIMTGANGRKMVLCNDQIISVGRSVTVNHEGTNFTWRLMAVTNGAPVWRRLVGAEKRAVLAW